MKKLVLFLTFLLNFISSFSQGYIESLSKKMKMQNIMESQYFNNIQLDYSTLSSKKLFIYRYDAKSAYNQLVRNKAFQNLKTDEEKKALYSKLWKFAYAESDLSKAFSGIEISDIDYDKLSEAEKEQYIYLSFYPSMGYPTIILWYHDAKENKPLNFLVTSALKLDFGNEYDFRFACAQISFYLGLNKEMKQKGTFESVAYNISKTNGKARSFAITTSIEYQHHVNDYEKRMLWSFLDNSNKFTLLIPEELKSPEYEKALDKWVFTKYEFLPKNMLDEKIANNEKGYCYIRSFFGGLGGLIMLIGTERDSLMQQTLSISFSTPTPAGTINMLANEINSKKVKYDKNSSILVETFDLTEEPLPDNLQNIKLGYITIKPKQHYKYIQLNKLILSNFKKSAIQHQIVEDAEELKDCRYRLRIKSFNTFEVGEKATITKVNKYVAGQGFQDTYSPGFKDDYTLTDYYNFFIYDTQTGKCHRLYNSFWLEKEATKKFFEAVEKK